MGWRRDLLKRGLSWATVNRRLAALRSLVKCARTVGLVTWNIEIPNVRCCARRNKATIARDRFLKLLDALDARARKIRGPTLFPEIRPRDTPMMARDRAILRLLYDLDLREVEVTGIDLEDVDLKGGVVVIKSHTPTAGGPWTLPDQTQKVLAAWIAKRGVGIGPLFTNFDRARKGNRLTGRSVYRIIKRIDDWAGTLDREAVDSSNN
jgi:integrase/recombinase XerC